MLCNSEFYIFNAEERRSGEGPHIRVIGVICSFPHSGIRGFAKRINGSVSEDDSSRFAMQKKFASMRSSITLYTCLRMN